jgi:SAM-dependent methyltransferase
MTLPIPPLHLRQSVGVEGVEFFENPYAMLAFGEHVPADKYDSVLDFGCGCGRVARQMLLQSDSVPNRYLGVDLYKPSIEWCSENLNKPGFEFRHINVYNAQLNPEGVLQSPIPTDETFSLVNSHSVFTHIIEPNLEFYFSECVRLMKPEAVMRATWFFFDKKYFPMMQDFQNCLYINPEDPTNATIYDLGFVRALYRNFGQRIVKVVPPGVRGHQWVVISANEAGDDVEFPADEGTFGIMRPPVRITSSQE